MNEGPTRVGAEPGAGYDDDLLRPVSHDEVVAASSSPLDELATALAQPVTGTIKPVRTKVPERPGVVLLYDARQIDNDKRKAWRKRATKSRPGREDETDELLFASLVIANSNIGVEMNGRTATDGEGTPLSFRHRQLWDMVDARDPSECIRKLFANDAHVLIASGEVLLAAGYDDDLSVDPTETATP